MFRHGQWVKFTLGDSPSILRDGQPEPLNRRAELLLGEVHRAGPAMVGLYQKAGKDALGVDHPAHVVPVESETGGNLRWLSGADGVLLAFPLESVAGLEAVTSREEIPVGRLAGAPADWQPQA